MIPISKIIFNGASLAPVLRKRASTVNLDRDNQQKSSFEGFASLGMELGF